MSRPPEISVEEKTIQQVTKKATPKKTIEGSRLRRIMNSMNPLSEAIKPESEAIKPESEAIKPESEAIKP